MKKNYFLIMIVLGFCSCQKELSKEGSNTNTSQQVDVYVAGYVSDNNSTIPAYWKNGRLVLIDSAFYTDAMGYATASALSIAVSGNDVYVAGYRTGFTANPFGAYWKNGVEGVDISTLSSSPSASSYQELTSLAVSNNDFYMVGFRSNIWGTGDPATYYKNGSSIDILDGSAGSDATSMAISGNDVYVAGVSISGSVFNGSQKLIAKYWKNGNPVKLTDGTKNAVAKSIAVSGTDVYVAGHEYNGSFDVAKYWKNGRPVNLTDGTKQAWTTSIAVSGVDVYVAGGEDNGSVYYIAKYWKNGNPVNLTDGSKLAEAKSIAVSGNDVYVAGYEDGVAKYWKNGKPVILGDVSKNSEAYSIFLVKK